MADQPDFTENTDLSAVLSPEDLAALEAKTQDILAHPLPTEADLLRLHEMRESSFARVDELVAESDGGSVAFDVSTPQGHIDALTLARRSFLNIAYQVDQTQDPITLQDLFASAFELWEQLTPQLQFNMTLEFVLGVARLTAPDDLDA